MTEAYVVAIVRQAIETAVIVTLPLLLAGLALVLPQWRGVLLAVLAIPALLTLTGICVLQQPEEELINFSTPVRRPVEKAMAKSGVKFITGAKATGYETQADGSLKVSVDVGGQKQTVDADVVLVAVGMRPNSENLGLDTIGATLDKRGHLLVKPGAAPLSKLVGACFPA